MTLLFLLRYPVMILQRIRWPRRQLRLKPLTTPPQSHQERSSAYLKVCLSGSWKLVLKLITSWQNKMFKASSFYSLYVSNTCSYLNYLNLMDKLQLFCLLNYISFMKHNNKVRLQSNWNWSKFKVPKYISWHDIFCYRTNLVAMKWLKFHLAENDLLFVEFRELW